MNVHPAVVLLCLVTCATASAQQGGAAPKVLWEWRASQGLADWTPNNEIADVRVTSEALSFRTTGPDPILAYTPALSVPTSPWQAFEVRMKADRDGRMELFWTETTEGPYGGFSGEKLTTYGVRGDGQWRTIRVFPFWQSVGKIVKLRFDPYDATSFSIAFMRIIELPAPARTTAQIRMPRDAGLWQTIDRQSAQPVADGLKLRADEEGGYGLAPVGGIVADRDMCVSVRLRTATVKRAALLFATDGVSGLQEIAFATVPDGRDHTYNIDALGHSSWKGNVRAVGLRFGSRARDECVLSALTVADTAQGPVDLRVLSFGIEEALPRAGTPITIAARITNAGGDAATAVEPRLTLPSGARIVETKAPAIERLRFGQEEEWRWKVVFAAPGEAKVGLRAVARGGAAASASFADTLTARPTGLAPGRIPPPETVTGKIDVGVYYFPGWRTSGQWAPITRFPERRPVLGWYREGDPDVADWHVKWAVEHGITFFAYDWYWSQGSRSLEHALHDGLFKARYRDRLKFCLLWANHNADNTSSHADMMAVTQYWIDHYFRLKEYYTIDGKPVMIIFTPHRFRADMGGKAVRTAFEAMREMCRKAGLKGLYMIACVGGSPSEAREAEAEGYDAVTAYNWPGLGVRGSDRWAPFADLLTPYREQWERLAADGPLPIMTPVSGGWDSRPWHGDAALVRSERTPELFRKHLSDAKAFIEAHPNKALPVALIEAWNEFGEGSYIEPHREYGFGYLDAIRDVFTLAPKDHTDLTPADVNMTIPQVDVASSTRGAWDLSRDAEGWDSGMNLSDIGVRDGGLTGVSAGTDPAFFGPPMQIPASDRTSIVIRMRLQASTPFEDQAQVFWTTRSMRGTSEEASVRFAVKGDGTWRTYKVSVGANPRWRGLITSLRIDPTNRAGVTVQISNIEIAK